MSPTQELLRPLESSYGSNASDTHGVSFARGERKPPSVMRRQELYDMTASKKRTEQVDSTISSIFQKKTC